MATGVTMSDATYARSKAGREKLKNDFAGDVDNLIKVLNGDKYAAFKKTITANWTGPDATDLLNDIEKTRAQLQRNLKALVDKFESAVDEDAKQFNNFQAKNIK